MVSLISLTGDEVGLQTMYVTVRKHVLDRSGEARLKLGCTGSGRDTRSLQFSAPKRRHVYSPSSVQV